MKKIVFFLTIGMMLTFGAFVYSDEQPITVKVNGEAVAFPDAVPFIDENGRTQVPMRFVSEKIGAKVDWADGQVTITKAEGEDELKIVLKVGSTWTWKYFNGANLGVCGLDTVPVLKEDRVFVPLRFISETYGAKVDWVAENRMVLIELEDVDYKALVSEVEYFNITPEEIKYPEVFEIAKLAKPEHFLQIAGRGFETGKGRESIIVLNFGELNKNNTSHLLLSVDIRKNPEWITFNLGKYDDTTLDLLKNILAIVYPDDVNFQNSLYKTMVDYRGKAGFQSLYNIKPGYEVYIDQTLPINENDGIWGKDAFNVWCKIEKI